MGLSPEVVSSRVGEPENALHGNGDVTGAEDLDRLVRSDRTVSDQVDDWHRSALGEELPGLVQFDGPEIDAVRVLKPSSFGTHICI